MAFSSLCASRLIRGIVHSGNHIIRRQARPEAMFLGLALTCRNCCNINAWLSASRIAYSLHLLYLPTSFIISASYILQNIYFCFENIFLNLEVDAGGIHAAIPTVLACPERPAMISIRDSLLSRFKFSCSLISSFSIILLTILIFKNTLLEKFFFKYSYH